ncbi:unnamed protein product [Rhizoctonia solani]|uniref:WD40 repeat-like protein n=1 Tax=Rhizoctonia solani TaxID=456999 RepID=A0A8H3HXY0_9AGAM|nr:unnamed protein product [Rhizoctonia solani]
MIAHEGHTNWVSSVVFSPSGDSVASGSYDHTIRIWDTHESSPIGEPFRGHSNEIHSVSYCPVGDLIASGSTDKTIRLWDVNTCRQLGQSLSSNHPFLSVAFSPNGKLIVSGSSGPYTSPTGCTVQLWDVLDRTVVSRPFKGHIGGIDSVAFSPDGTQVISGSFDRTIRVWDVQRGAMILGPLKGHTSAVRSITFSPDGTQLLSCSIDHTIRHWDIISGRMIGEPYKGHTDWVNSVSFSPRGTYVASGGSDNTVRLWDVRIGRQLDEYFQEHSDCVYSVAFSPTGQYIASGSLDRRVIIRAILSKYPDSDDDDGPRVTTSHMSIQQIFECFLRAGCVDLSLQMDTRQETARIVSGGGSGYLWKGELHNGARVAIKARPTSALGPVEYKTLKNQHAARELYLFCRMDHPHIH